MSLKFLPSLQQTFIHTRYSSSSFIDTLSLIRRTACARAQFSGCSSTLNAHSETGQIAVCCQNLTLDALSRRSALSVLVGALFKNLSLFEHASYFVPSDNPWNPFEKPTDCAGIRQLSVHPAVQLTDFAGVCFTSRRHRLHSKAWTAIH
jgi:hypothetical protein